MSGEAATAPEVAVMTGADGATAALDEDGKVVVFRRDRGTWRPVREEPLSLGDCRGLAELRSRMAGLVRFLGDCRLFVAGAATGVPYYELEKARCTVWELPGRPEEFLEQVWAEGESEAVASPPRAPDEVPVPVERAPGHFTISIKDVQKCRPELSSKKVLQQFVLKGRFTTLEVLCDHLPPWIELEAQRGSFALETEQRGENEILVRLIKTEAPAPGAPGSKRTV